MTSLFSGEGPGARTSDGCSVELYRALPYLGELDDIIEALPYGARCLELGCGAGRLTRRLLDQGVSVTAVDNSADMLASVPREAEPILCGIEHLSLPQRYDTAILASCLVNHPEMAMRTAFLAAGRRHLGQGGRMFVQRHDPSWLRRAHVGEVRQAQDGTITVETLERTGDDVSMRIRYDRPEGTWWHSFAVAVLDDRDTESALHAAGFQHTAWQGQAKRWICAWV